MARALWSGSISFGLVNVPVRLFTAVRPKEVRFHLLHRKDGARVHQKYFCELDEEEVPREQMAKGYELSRGRYVQVDPDELKELDPKATHAIEIQDFVGLEEIDPLYWEHSYHVVPDEGAQRSFGLLVQTLKASGKVGIARVVMHSRQYLCTVRPLGRGMVLSTMQFADEVVSQEDLEGLPDREFKADPRELQMAQQLVDALTTRFEPEKYRDDYRARVLELIDKLAKGEKWVAEAPPRPQKVVNLMEALKASLAQAKGGAAAASAEKGEMRHRAHAARTRSHRGNKRAKAK